VVTYRMTSPEREARRLPPGSAPNDRPYVQVVNPIAGDRDVLRQSLLSSVLEIVERNARLRERMALFEIGPVFAVAEEGELPEETPVLAIVLTGPRNLPAWQGGDQAPMDFYDLKGVLEGLFEGLHLAGVRYEPTQHPSFHPGKCARILVGERYLGIVGELHPQVREHYELPVSPLLAAELDLESVQAAIPLRYEVEGVPTYPPVLEDLALVVDEVVPAEQVEAMMRQAAGKTLAGVRLFDVYRGGQAGAGKKSLAYSLTYQAPDRTLTDQEVLQIRQRIIRRLEQELGAKLRS